MQEGDNMKTFQQFCKDKGLSEAIVRMWRFRHGLPIVQVGKRIFVDESDFQRWIEAHKQNVPGQQKY